MKQYFVQFARAARKELDAIQAKTRERILAAIVDLENDPRPTNCKKLRGSTDKYRIRIGDYRVVYEVCDTTVRVLIVRVAHRKDAYD